MHTFSHSLRVGRGMMLVHSVAGLGVVETILARARATSMYNLENMLSFFCVSRWS